MPYPPSTIASNKTDATTSATDHPGHHNTLATAVNDIVTELGADPSGTFTTVQDRLASHTHAAIADPGNATANTSYTDGVQYWSYVTTANGWPVNGLLSGARSGTNHVQRLQDQASGSTYARYWNNGGSVWTSWIIYVDAHDFDVKGDLLAGTGADAYTRLPVGTDGQVLTAASGQASGLQWATLPTTSQKVKLTADLAAYGTATLVNLTGLSFSVSSGVYYRFSFYVIHQSAASTTGIKLGLTYPASTIFAGNVKAHASASAVADGSDVFFEGPLTTSGDSVTSLGVPAATTNFVSEIWGFILPSAAGTLQVQYSPEVAANITIKQGTHGLLWTI